MVQTRTIDRVELRDITGDRDLYRPVPLEEFEVDMGRDALHDAIDAIPGASSCELALGLLRCATDTSENLTVHAAGIVIWHFTSDQYQFVFYDYDEVRAMGRSFEASKAIKGKNVGIGDLVAQPHDPSSYRYKLGSIGLRKRHPDADAMEHLVNAIRRIQWKYGLHEMSKKCARRAWRHGFAFHDDELTTYLAA